MKCSFLSSISPVEITLLAVLVAFIFIAELNDDELNVVGNWFIGVGGLAVVAATQGAFLSGLEKDAAKDEIIRKQIELLRGELDSLSGRLRTGRK